MPICVRIVSVFWSDSAMDWPLPYYETSRTSDSFSENVIVGPPANLLPQFSAAGEPKMCCQSSDVLKETCSAWSPAELAKLVASRFVGYRGCSRVHTFAWMYIPESCSRALHLRRSKLVGHPDTKTCCSRFRRMNKMMLKPSFAPMKLRYFAQERNAKKQEKT